MTDSLFGARPTGASFTDNLRRALDYAGNNLHRSGNVPLDAESVAALVDDVAPPPGAVANVGTELAAPVAVANAGDDLAAAARAVALDTAETGFRVNALRTQLEAAIALARTNANAPAAAVTAEAAQDVAAAAVKPNLLERIRANAPDLSALRAGSAYGAAAMVDDAVGAAATAGNGAARAGLLDELRRAAQFAAKVSPRG
jgi:hypothetical protein